MRGRKTALVVLLTDQERQQLQQWVRSTTKPVGLVKRAQAVLLVAQFSTLFGSRQSTRPVKRAQAVLLVAQGVPLKHTAAQVGLTERHVRAWITRFLKQRIAGLYDRQGRGRKPSFSPSGGPARR